MQTSCPDFKLHDSLSRVDVSQKFLSFVVDQLGIPVNNLKPRDSQQKTRRKQQLLFSVRNPNYTDFNWMNYHSPVASPKVIKELAQN